MKPGHGITVETDSKYSIYHPDAIPSPQAAYDDGYRFGYQTCLQDVKDILEDEAAEAGRYNPREETLLSKVLAKILSYLTSSEQPR